IVLRRFGILEAARQFLRHQYADRLYLAAVKNDDGRVAGPLGEYRAGRGNLRNGVVLNAEVAEWRNCFLGSIRKPGFYFQLAGFTRLAKSILTRRDDQGLHVAAALGASRAGRNPFTEYLILPGALGEADTSFVRNLASGLREQEAIVGIHRIDAPAHAVASQRVEVFVGVEAKERQSKAVLALEGAVARAGVAAQLAE